MITRDWLIAGAVGLLTTGLITWWGVSQHWDAPFAVSVAGLAVSVGGFALALVAIQRTKTIADATRTAIQQTLRGVAAGRLGPILTEMSHVAAELDEAVAARQADRAKAPIRQWWLLAARAERLVRRRFGKKHASLPPLKRSVRGAREAKAALAEGSDDPLKIAAECLVAVEKALERLDPLVEDLMPTMEEEADGS